MALKDDKPILPKKDIHYMFSNIEEIKDINKAFLSKLEKSAREWPSWNSIGQAFLETVPSFTSYITYVSKQFGVISGDRFRTPSRCFEPQQDQQTMDQIPRCIATHFCLKEQDAKEDKLGGNLNIESFLIMPIQRIPRYELLLKVTQLCIHHRNFLNWHRKTTSIMRTSKNPTKEFARLSFRSTKRNDSRNSFNDKSLLNWRSLNRWQ